MNLDEFYAWQIDHHRRDPGFRERDLDMPIAAILSVDGRWDHDQFFRLARERMKARVSEYLIGGCIEAVALEYDSRPPQLWVSAQCDAYVDLFERFCSEKLNVKVSGNYKNAGYDLDHAYCKSAVPKEVQAFIRLFVVPRKANRSWGGYFERKLKDRFAKELRVGFRNETVAIRAKVSGISAPRLGRRVRRRAERIRDIVDQLIELEMIDRATGDFDYALLVAFCEVVNGKAKYIWSEMSERSDGLWSLATWVENSSGEMKAIAPPATGLSTGLASDSRS